TTLFRSDPESYWLPSYIETALLRAIWYPSTVASVSHYCKGIIRRALEKSADNTESLIFRLHDFGSRGASSQESVALGSLAHLVNFAGTDSMRSEEHTSELQSRENLVCRLQLEK